MPDGGEAFTVRVAPRIADVPQAAWDGCAGADNPFVSHAFLQALEESGSVGAEAGWLPLHLLVEDPQGQLLGAAPLYLKSHSYGEYVFDHGWAEAYERAGGRYYPKLQCAVPFTPVPGPRLLARPGPQTAEIRDALATAMVEIMRRHQASSVHVTFPTEAEWSALGALGFLQRTGVQFHWHNHGYHSFDDFLATLAARKRKAIRKERREAVAGGLTLHTLTGTAIRAEHWDAFFAFYMDTGSRKWGSPYLNRAFFDCLGAGLADRIALVMAAQDRRWVAGALNLIGGDALYGRNWGCLGEFKFLHFEACYYRAIDFAIERGLARVEAGAQGPHKIQRGYVPVPTYSAHWIADPGLRKAVADFLVRERRHMERERAVLAEFSPYRREDTPESG
ncbi:MAG: N-acetyltransferase [Alphaproteobacteria bacterium]|nr:N-acetyltransferase [Alphaproteobacteria bacterium]